LFLRRSNTIITIIIPKIMMPQTIEIKIIAQIGNDELENVYNKRFDRSRSIKNKFVPLVSKSMLIVVKMFDSCC
jgi:hypothetical protein